VAVLRLRGGRRKKIKIRDLCSPAVAALAPVAARNSSAAALAALVEVVAVVVAPSPQVLLLVP
jgi:hypothetical protein